MTVHWAIFIDNDSHKEQFVLVVVNQSHADFKEFDTQKGALLSPLALTKFVDQEERHGRSALQSSGQPLKSLSSGEQKKALLFHVLETRPDYMILDNPFDNLDSDFQAELKQLLTQKSKNINFIQLASRKADLLPFISRFAILNKGQLTVVKDIDQDTSISRTTPFQGQIPKPIHQINMEQNTLIEFKNVSISYCNKPILKNITWKIKKKEFWQLVGKNGSGKTTLLSMIVGDNPKAFGQDIYIFGKKKGSGESVWDIKEKIGYFSSNMTDKFTGRHTVEHMLISGLTDSIGLYTKPSEAQKRTSKKWLVLLNFWEKRNTLFKDLSLGQQRLVMTARAMIKHPPLLILDEPTAGMDDTSAQLLVALVKKIAAETDTSIVFVSHRTEPGLLPKSIFRLEMHTHGSTGSSANGA